MYFFVVPMAVADCLTGLGRAAQCQTSRKRDVKVPPSKIASPVV
jgi:hypothetical protein